MYDIGQVIKGKWIIENYITDIDDVTGYVCKNIETQEYKIIDDSEFINKNCIN